MTDDDRGAATVLALALVHLLLLVALVGAVVGSVTVVKARAAAVADVAALACDLGLIDARINLVGLADAGLPFL